MRGKKAEIAALGCIGTPGDVKTVFFLQEMEQHHVTHAGIGAGIRKNIPRGRNEQNIGAFFIKLRLYRYTGLIFNIFDEKIEHIFERMGLNPQVITGSVTVGYRCRDPVDVQSE